MAVHPFWCCCCGDCVCGCGNVKITTSGVNLEAITFPDDRRYVGTIVDGDYVVKRFRSPFLPGCSYRHFIPNYGGFKFETGDDCVRSLGWVILRTSDADADGQPYYEIYAAQADGAPRLVTGRFIWTTPEATVTFLGAQGGSAVITCTGDPVGFAGGTVDDECVYVGTGTGSGSGSGSGTGIGSGSGSGTGSGGGSGSGGTGTGTGSGGGTGTGTGTGSGSGTGTGSGASGTGTGGGGGTGGGSGSGGGTGTGSGSDGSGSGGGSGGSGSGTGGGGTGDDPNPDYSYYRLNPCDGGNPNNYEGLYIRADKRANYPDKSGTAYDGACYTLGALYAYNAIPEPIGARQFTSSLNNDGCGTCCLGCNYSDGSTATVSNYATYQPSDASNAYGGYTYRLRTATLPKTTGGNCSWVLFNEGVVDIYNNNGDLLSSNPGQNVYVDRIEYEGTFYFVVSVGGSSSSIMDAAFLASSCTSSGGILNIGGNPYGGTISGNVSVTA